MKSCMWWTSAKNAESYQRLPTIAKLAERVGAAVGRSGNLELVPQLTKLGGNGPIMANALASLGLKVTYLGNLGYPNLHPIFPRLCHPRRSPQHRRTRHHRRPGVRGWEKL